MRSIVVMTAGVLMLLSSLAHGFIGWSAMRAGLDSAGAPGDLVGALSVGWYWGSVGMAGFGLITLHAGLRLRRGNRSGVPVVLLVAACYLIFGVVAFVSRNFNPHFLLFIATGLLAGLPLLGGGPSPSGTVPS